MIPPSDSRREIGLPGAALCAANKICATVEAVQRPSSRPSDHGAIYLKLIAFVFVAMAFLGGSSAAPLTGTDWATRHSVDRIEQIEAPNHSMPAVSLDPRFSEDAHEETVELTESTDDDETNCCLPHLAEFAVRTQTGYFESSTGRAPTPFRLRAFSTRGSPLA